MSNTDQLHELHRRPGFLLKRCHQVTTAIFLDECRDFNVTTSQYSALQVLAACPGIDQIALGRLSGLDRSTVGLVIRLLEERGLLERWTNQRDKRRMQLKLSPEGEKLLADITPAAHRARARVLAVLPPEQRAQFTELLVGFLEGHGALIDAEAILAGKPGPEPFDFSGESPRPRTASRKRAG